MQPSENQEFQTTSLTKPNLNTPLPNSDSKKGSSTSSDTGRIATSDQTPGKGKPFLIRGAAYLIDDVIITAVIFPLEIIFLIVVHLFVNIYGISTGFSFETKQPSWLLICFLTIVLDLIYLTFFTWLAGTTPGKIILRMRVVNEAGGRVGFRGALIRSVVFFFDSLIFGLFSYFRMKPPLYQRNGDVMAKTVVVGTKDPIIKQTYSKRRFFLSSAIFIFCTALAMLILSISTVSQPRPLVKIPASQINLVISDVPDWMTLKNDTNNLPGTTRSVTDSNSRDFEGGTQVIRSEVLVFNSFLSDTNASLKAGNESSLIKFFGDPQISFTQANEFNSSERGLIEKFASNKQNVDGYSLLMVSKNVSIHIFLYGNPGSVTLNQIETLQENILSRIP